MVGGRAGLTPSDDCTVRLEPPDQYIRTPIERRSIVAG
jgi:hypothetical protein